MGVCKSCGLGLVCLGGREPGLSNNATTPPHQVPIPGEGVDVDDDWVMRRMYGISVFAYIYHNFKPPNVYR